MIHLNIGSNLDSKHGSRFDNISLAINLLVYSKIKIKKISNYYETPSYPNRKFPNFLNVGLIINYDDSHLTLLRKIKLIEKKLGRIRTKKNGPRIIDIDIIDFNNKIIATNDLILPHPKCHLRNFVLFPIFQIDPDWSHPIIKKKARRLFF